MCIQSSFLMVFESSNELQNQPYLQEAILLTTGSPQLSRSKKFFSDNYYYSWNILMTPCTTLLSSLIGKSALQLPTFSGSHIFWPYWLINSVLVILRRPSLHFEGPCKKLTWRRCRLYYCCWLIGGLRESGQTNILQTI